MTANPDTPHIGIVVEGPGDFASVPLLLRNYMNSREDYRDILGNRSAVTGVIRH